MFPLYNKDISVMGEAKTIQKFLNKDYIDEIQIKLEIFKC